MARRKVKPRAATTFRKIRTTVSMGVLALGPKSMSVESSSSRSRLSSFFFAMMAKLARYVEAAAGWPAPHLRTIVIDPRSVAKTKIAQNPHNEDFATGQAYFAYCDGIRHETTKYGKVVTPCTY